MDLKQNDHKTFPDAINIPEEDEKELQASFNQKSD
jgi:hypothetical protein